MSTNEQIQLEEVEFLPLGENPGDFQQPPQEEPEEEKDTKDESLVNDEEINEEAELEDSEDTDQIEDDPEDHDDTDDTEQTPLYKSLVDKLGLELDEDEMNTLLETEETDEGFAQVGVTLAEKLAKQRFDGLMEQYPEAKQLVDYQKNGGNPEEFFDTFYPAIDYNEVEIAEDDPDIQKDVIAESLKAQGFDDSDIEETINDYEAGGILNKQAERSLKLLRNKQEQQKKEFATKQEQLAKQKEKQVEQEREQVKEIISEKGIKGIQVPDSQRDQFEEYLYKPVTEDGRSQALVDSQNLDLETRLMIGYLQMNDFDFSKLVETQSKNKNVRNLRSSLKGGDKLKDKQEGKSATYSKTPNFNKIEPLF